MLVINLKSDTHRSGHKVPVHTGILSVFFILFILPLVTCPLWGQVVQKQNLSLENYHKWGRLLLDKISGNEQWVAFKMFYENKSDTLFVRSIEKDKTYSFPASKKSIFTAENFVCLSSKELNILDLKTGKTEIINGVSDFVYSKAADLLAVIISDDRKNKTLTLRSPKGKIIKTIAHFQELSMDQNGHNLLYAAQENGKSSLFLMNLKNVSQRIVITDYEGSCTNFAWQKNGGSVAFNRSIKSQAPSFLYYYHLGTDKLYAIDSKSLNFPNESYITDSRKFKLLISDDGQRIFFSYKIKDTSIEPNTESAVQIWNGNDKWVYSDEQYMGQFEKTPKTALWNPFSNTVIAVTDAWLPSLKLSGDQKYALLSSPKAYEPQWEMDSPRDFYIMNLETAEKKLCIEKQDAQPRSTLFSTTGKYIAYFKVGNWWIYNISTQKHICITKNIQTKFTGRVQLLDPDSHWGASGWSNDDKEILLYDQYDIWAVNCDATSFKRLTHGRETKTKYRITEFLGDPVEYNEYDGVKTGNFDIDKDLVLRAEGDDGKTGWWRWSKKSGEKAIVYDSKLVDQLYYNSKNKKIIYTEQDFDLSPRLVIKKNFGSAKPFFKSNPQQEKYFWGRSEMIYYKNKHGENLKGVLIYPADYDDQKKYPMIVNIYELQSYKIHQYKNPSISEYDGFNRTVASLQGYFVLLPDLVAQPENIGEAVTDCANAAVKKVLEKGIIDPSKIGLIGHSFGGYETSQIITQTDIFAAAVAGGGITDLTSLYLTVSQNSGKPDMWRFEKEQWLLAKTPVEAPSLFQKNSPIYNADKVKTPILIWAGKDDKQVDVRQSIEYYLILRRLGKKTVMLLYPDEDHVIFKTLNQNDLSSRIKQWFDYYLKDDLSAQWITKGTE
jgi:dipeptidyl aminopeptidase/acylaminoacyl peptidase